MGTVPVHVYDLPGYSESIFFSIKFWTAFNLKGSLKIMDVGIYLLWFSFSNILQLPRLSLFYRVFACRCSRT
jgi:hypothetical protein